MRGSLNVCVTHRCRGDDFLGDDPQRVNHRDVAEPPSYTESCVTILNKRKQSVTHQVCICC